MTPGQKIAAEYVLHVDDDVPRLAADIDKALKSHDDAIGELLAVIHGDGGHYQDEHGTEKACRDAVSVYYARLKSKRREEIAEALEQAVKCCDDEAQQAHDLIRRVYMSQAMSDEAKEDEAGHYRQGLNTAEALAVRIRALIGTRKDGGE